MSYSSVSSRDRGSREGADLWRAFILAVIQPERESGSGLLSCMLPAVHTHTLVIIKRKVYRPASFPPNRAMHTHVLYVCLLLKECGGHVLVKSRRNEKLITDF